MSYTSSELFVRLRNSFGNSSIHCWNLCVMADIILHLNIYYFWLNHTPALTLMFFKVFRKNRHSLQIEPDANEASSSRLATRLAWTSESLLTGFIFRVSLMLCQPLFLHYQTTAEQLIISVHDQQPQDDVKHSWDWCSCTSCCVDIRITLFLPLWLLTHTPTQENAVDVVLGIKMIKWTFWISY